MKLARIEVLDHHGHVQQVHDVSSWPVRIGRALDNDLVLGDPHVAAHHAELAPGSDGLLCLRVTESRNGAQMERGRQQQTLAAGEAALWTADTRARLGRTVLRVQRAEDPVPDELPLATARPEAGWQLPLLVLLVLVWQGVLVWLQDRPDTKPLDQVAPLVGLASAATLWAGGWGLATKLFSGRFVLVPHLRLALLALLVSAAVGSLLPALAFSLDLPLLSRLRGWTDTLIGAWLLSRHLAIVVPRHERRAMVLMGVMAVATLGFQVAGQWQRNDRWFAELYADMLLPPALRLAPTRPVDDVVQELQALEQPLLERARKARDEEFEP